VHIAAVPTCSKETLQKLFMLPERGVRSIGGIGRARRVDCRLPVKQKHDRRLPALRSL
jgi:hypothetical protein